jgi:uracil-DNA glycosylase family 4
MPPTDEATRKARLAAFNARLRACRRCHSAGFLDERESLPVAFDAGPEAPMPRILLIGQAPGLGGSTADRPFAGITGDRLRAWFEAGGIARGDFYRKIHFAAVTRCYPGRLAGARGDRLPAPAERELCRPWLEEVVAIVEPEVVILLGLLAIRTILGPVPSLSAVVGTGRVVDGVRYLPLPHPSGVSRWLNDPPNLEAVARGLIHLKGWIEELGI